MKIEIKRDDIIYFVWLIFLMFIVKWIFTGDL